MASGGKCFLFLVMITPGAQKCQSPLRPNVIASKAHSPEIGQVIDHALEEIGKLGDLFAESHRLKAGIREKLAGIGFNVK